MKWSEHMIARAISLQTLARKCIVLVAGYCARPSTQGLEALLRLTKGNLEARIAGFTALQVERRLTDIKAKA